MEKDTQPIISFLIINFNTKLLTEKCISCIINKKVSYAYEIVLVDNGSDDGSIEYFGKKMPFVKLIDNKKNLGFGKANNLAAKASQGKYLFLINSDAFVKGNAIDLLIDYLESHPKTDVVAPALLNEDGTFQPNARIRDSFLNELLILTFLSVLLRYLVPGYYANIFSEYYSQVQFPLGFTGACFVIRRDLFISVKGFDEQFFFTAEEVDLFRRTYNGRRNFALIPNANVVHLGGQSSILLGDFGDYSIAAENIKYDRKWYGKTCATISLLLFTVRMFIKRIFGRTSKHNDPFRKFIAHRHRLLKLCLRQQNPRHEVLS